MVYTSGIFAFITCHTFHCQCLGIERVRQQPLQSFHFAVMTVFLSLYDTHLQLFNISTSLVPVDAVPISRSASRCTRFLVHLQFLLFEKFCKFSRKDRPAGSQPAFAWDAVSIPIRPHYKVGVRFFQRSLPAFLSAFLAVSFPNIRRERGLNTFHVINRVG